MNTTTIIGESGTVLLEGVRAGGRSNTGVVIDEDVSRKSKVTENPVETGSNVNDHILFENNGFSITAMVVDGNMRDILKRMHENGELVKYRGIESFDDLVITDLKMKYTPNNQSGFALSMTFKKLLLVSAQKVKIKGSITSMAQSDASTKKSPTTKKATGKPSNKGTQTAQSAPVSVKSYNSAISSKVASKLGR